MTAESEEQQHVILPPISCETQLSTYQKISKFTLLRQIVTPQELVHSIGNVGYTFVSLELNEQGIYKGAYFVQQGYSGSMQHVAIEKALREKQEISSTTKLIDIQLKPSISDPNPANIGRVLSMK